MARNKLKPDQDLSFIQQELIDTIVEEYRNNTSLKGTAKALGMSFIKVRKALITANQYSCNISEEVKNLIEQGKDYSYIAEILGTTVSNVYNYVPYKVRAYGLPDKTVEADRVERYRRRISTIKELQDCIDKDLEWRDILWKAIEMFEGQRFKTSGRGTEHRGAVHFKYEMKVSTRTGEKTEELIISSRKAGKSLTRSSVELAFENAISTQRNCGFVSGPKKLQTFGSSYLYSIFLKWGIITDTIVNK